MNKVSLHPSEIKKLGKNLIQVGRAPLLLHCLIGLDLGCPRARCFGLGSERFPALLLQRGPAPPPSAAAAVWRPPVRSLVAHPPACRAPPLVWRQGLFSGEGTEEDFSLMTGGHRALQGCC